MKHDAQVVIVGGGVAGASIAFHLTEMGCNDVMLLDRNELTSGSTFHSAGLVGQLRSTEPLTKMMMYGVELNRRLEEVTGQTPGWSEVGSLRLASSQERLDELRRLAGWARTFGLPLEVIGTEEAHKLWPLFDPEGVQGAAYLPTDGYLDPSSLTFALAKGAKAKGALILTHMPVLGLEIERGRVRGVRTTEGLIRASVVVNAGGIWAHEIGKLAGIDVPVIPMAHEFVTTRPLEGVATDLPTMRDPDALVYFRQESGGLVVGGYERDPAPWGIEGIPRDFNNRLLEPDWDRYMPLMHNALSRVPALGDAEIVKLINGPEAFTPDGEFILGESAVRGFFVAAGLCAHGIAGAGGVGKVMAEWILEGRPSLDIWKMDILRFGRHHRSRSYSLARTVEIYSTYYDIHFPNEERKAARGLRLSPAYSRLESLGASFGEKAGWERPNWFNSNEDDSYEGLRPRGWAGHNWSTAIVTEHMAARQCAAMFDETSFAKIDVTGTGARDFLQRLCDNDIDRRPGTIVYTSMLNERGGIECNFTVTRIGERQWRIVTGSAFGNHDLGWMKSQQLQDDSVEIRDVTSSLACVGLWGPRARDILQAACEDDLSNAAFPYMTAREIIVGDVICLALRVTYVGELGWELYPPMESGLRLWDTLWEAGRPHGLVPGGYRAIDSLRLEKGYRVWGADITPEDNPYEAGLSFTVKLDKVTSFIGREALGKPEAMGPARRLSCLVLDDVGSVVLGNEPVIVDGRIVGRVTSGGVGYSVGKSIAYAYLPAELADVETKLSVEMFGRPVRAQVSSEPLWDPGGDRIRS